MPWLGYRLGKKVTETSMELNIGIMVYQKNGLFCVVFRIIFNLSGLSFESMVH